MYKLFAQVIGDVDSTLADTLDELNIRVTKEEMRCNIKPLMRLICNRFLGDLSGFVDMCVEHIKSPLDNAKDKVNHIYTGPKEGLLYDNMIDCNQNGNLMVHSSKMYPTDDCTFFQVKFSRIIFALKTRVLIIILIILGFGTCNEWDIVCRSRGTCSR